MDERLSEPLGSVILATGSSETPRERIRKAIHSHLERYREEARIMGVIEQVSRYDEHVNAVRFARHTNGQILSCSLPWLNPLATPL